MNIAAIVPGTNCKPRHFTIQTYGPDLDQLVIADFYYGYHYGNTGPLSGHITRKLFARRIARGNLVCNAMFEGNDLVAVFGVAARVDKWGRYVEVEFFLGDFGNRLKEALRLIVRHTFKLGMVLTSMTDEPVRMRFRGRDGWRRILPTIGVKIDGQGYVTHYDQSREWLQ